METNNHNLPELSLSDMVPVDDIMHVTERLMGLLAEEAEYFRAMNIKAVAALQPEKNQLVAWLEAQQKMLAVHSDPAALIDEDEREAIAATIDQFTAIAEDNFHQAGVARKVNKKVVEAVTKAIRDQEGVNTYNAAGANRAAADITVSYKLNQQA